MSLPEPGQCVVVRLDAASQIQPDRFVSAVYRHHKSCLEEAQSLTKTGSAAVAIVIVHSVLTGPDHSQ